MHNTPYLLPHAYPEGVLHGVGSGVVSVPGSAVSGTSLGSLTFIMHWLKSW